MTSKVYKDFTVEVAFLSSIVTPYQSDTTFYHIQSDTIFGHICWAIEHMNGSVEGFLKLYDSSPPLLVSSGFPKGFLPRPVLGPLTQKELKEIFGDGERADNAHLIKTIKKTELISKASFQRLMENGPLTPQGLFRALMDEMDDMKSLMAQMQSVQVQHNSINRFGRISDGGLYQHEETFFTGAANQFEIYVRTNRFSIEDIKAIFAFIGENGYGKNKSTGKGHFEVKAVEEGFALPVAREPNAFMTLSSYVPGEEDPAHGYYRLIHKYGKLGGDFAGYMKRPFKKPLIMFAPGSVFFCQKFDKERFYGSLLTDVHTDKRIRHYAYAFPMGINVEEAGR